MSGGERSARPIPLIMGPTAAGKTDVALRLAERLPLEIVSVDSAMVYRGLNIGAGKPARETLARHPHHLVDILDPVDTYSAGQFVRDAVRAIDEIRARGRTPLLVGGTMLYFRALRRGIAALPEADAAVRAELDAEAAREGWPALHAQLLTIDPQAGARIQPRDGQRIQRALEVYRLTGQTISALQLQTRPARADLRFAAFAWSPERSCLHEAIERRLQQMMQLGFLEEVKGLRARGDLSAASPSMRSVGYRQLWEHLESGEPLDEAVRRAVIATRHLARRQLIWLRSERDLEWIDPLEASAVAHMEQAIAMLCV